MHLRDYLHDIPLKALKTMADAVGVKVEYRARIKLMNAIDRLFWDGEIVDRLLDGLTVDRKLILSILAFSYRTGVTEQQILKKAEKIAGLGRRDALAILNGLMPYALAGGIDDDERRYFCPGGAAERVRSRLIGENGLVEKHPEEAVALSPTNLLEDMFAFLAHASKIGIPLTLIGRVRKVVLELIFKGSPTCVSGVPGISKDMRTNFILEYLRSRSLIESGNKELRATRMLDRWLTLSMTERLNDIVSFAYEYRVQDETTVVTLQGFLSELDPGDCFEPGRIAEFLHTQTAAPGGLKRISSRVRDFVFMLSHLGMLSVRGDMFSVTNTGWELFRGKRLSIDDAMGTHFTMQPNFDVIVGPELDPAVRFMLEILADRRSRDTVLTFKVSQEGVNRARERGMASDDIVRFFLDHSRTPVPQNVRFSLESWAERYGTLYFENVTLLRCRDTATMSRIVHLPELEPYIVEQLSDTAVVVSERQMQSITAILKREGFAPESFGEDQRTVSQDGDIRFEPRYADHTLREQSIAVDHARFIMPPELIDTEDSP